MLSAAGVVHVFDLADVDRVAVLNGLRRGDHVYLRHVHLLAERQRRTDWSPQRDLAEWIIWLVERGVVIVELSTGRRADTRAIGDLGTLLAMVFDAAETIRVGGRGRAIRIARENGAKSKGRPRWDRQHRRDEAEAIYKDASITGTKRLDRALRRVEWTYKHAWEVFGPRHGGGGED